MNLTTRTLVASVLAGQALLLTATSDVRSRAGAEADLAAAGELLEIVATFISSQATEEPGEPEDPTAVA